MPPEYCEYSCCFDKCSEFLKQKYPDLYETAKNGFEERQKKKKPEEIEKKEGEEN
ncbi:MAG: hypothetical protein ACK52J_03675 [bacterium]|jgi:hypothetical protein